jgi:predicted DNA-binding WGR domain protein
MAERRFEFNEGSSSKFWAIERRARKVTVMFGRIGSEGQNKAKSFSTDAKAAHEEQRLVAEKLRKGYREVKGRGKVKVPPAKKVAAAHKTAVKAQGGKGKTTYRQVEHLVWVDQHVITLKDAKTDWDGRWTNDAFGKEKGIGVAEGVVSLVNFARAAGHVPMLFEIHAEPSAADDVDDYEAVLEASIRLRSRKLSIENEGGSEGTVSVPDATDWRLRAYFANGDTARYDCGDGAEHVRIVLYPGPSAATDVMKLRRRGLGELVRKYRGPRSDAELRAMLLGPNLSYRCLATVALLQKGRLDLVSSAVPKTGAVRAVYASTVWFAGAAAEPILDELAKSRDPDVRTRAAQSIGFLGAKALSPTLEALKRDKDALVRQEAEYAIEKLEEGGTR